MISTFISFLPFILTAYFLFRSLDEPVFIMGIPFLMFLGSSIFFEKVDGLLAIPFRSFDSIDKNPDILLLVWLTICWVIFKVRSNKKSENTIGNKYSSKHINILDYFIICLMIITIIGLGIVLNEYYIVEKVFDEFFILMSLFLGFFIMKDMVLNTEAKVLENFLFNIVIINSIASGLYFIHQGLHIELYPRNLEYITEVVDGELITRTFWFMPVLWLFSISYLLVIKRKNHLINIILLAVNMLGIYISYTRSFLLNAVSLFFLYFLLIGYKNKNIWNALKSILVIGVTGFALFLVLSSFLPTSTKYFLSRFKELDAKPGNAQSNNLVYRFYKTDRVINKMNAKKILFGYGSVTETQTPFIKMVNAATADMGWAEVVFRWGYLGLALFILLYIFSIIKAFLFFMRSEGIVSQFALLLLLTVVSQAIEGFTSYAFLYPERFAMGLWYFGILSALLIGTNRDENKSRIEYAYDES
jgi:hypothetical protein